MRGKWRGRREDISEQGPTRRREMAGQAKDAAGAKIRYKGTLRSSPSLFIFPSQPPCPPSSPTPLTTPPSPPSARLPRMSLERPTLVTLVSPCPSYASSTSLLMIAPLIRCPHGHGTRRPCSLFAVRFHLAYIGFIALPYSPRLLDS